MATTSPRSGLRQTAPRDLAAAAEAAEAHHRRMWRLRQMDAGELRTILAGEPKDAAPWVDSAARYGLAEAQVRLGQMYLDGAGVPRDEAQALAWFTRAARQGAADAMNMVGRCHENGWGAPVDLAEAAGWYRRSADAGDDWGAYNYAHALFDGRGVARDREAAADWYRRASDQGHTRAMNLLARCYEEGWGVARDPAQAAEWYRRSADGGYFRAQFNYATLLAAAGRTDEALALFDTACRAATPEGLTGMTEALMGHGDPHLAAIGRRYAHGAGRTAGR